MACIDCKKRAELDCRERRAELDCRERAERCGVEKGRWQVESTVLYAGKCGTGDDITSCTPRLV